MVVSYHLATLADVTRLSELAALTWQDTYPGIISQGQIDYMLGLMYNHKVITDQITAGQISWLVAVQLGEPQWVGYASYGPHPDRPNVFRLHKLYLHPKVKGQGYGKQLLQEILKRLPDDTTQLELNVNKRNPAYQFYVWQGFKVIDEKVLDIGQGYVMDDYIMGLDLV
jgi:GNAT superfamily N-acetyltransferase